jgi:hypothetical protein
MLYNVIGTVNTDVCCNVNAKSLYAQNMLKLLCYVRFILKFCKSRLDYSSATAVVIPEERNRNREADGIGC